MNHFEVLHGFDQIGSIPPSPSPRVHPPPSHGSPNLTVKKNSLGHLGVKTSDSWVSSQELDSPGKGTWTLHCNKWPKSFGQVWKLCPKQTTSLLAPYTWPVVPSPMPFACHKPFSLLKSCHCSFCRSGIQVWLSWVIQVWLSWVMGSCRAYGISACDWKSRAPWLPRVGAGVGSFQFLLSG